MKKAKIHVYIRFGEIPEDENSKVYSGDEVVREEAGVSVWDAVEVDGMYYPVLPKHPNDNTMADYFNLLLKSTDNVYLVTGDRIFVEGADREPLLINVKVLKDITRYYRRNMKRKNIIQETDKEEK